jgi:hypothetical protein
VMQLLSTVRKFKQASWWHVVCVSALLTKKQKCSKHNGPQDSWLKPYAPKRRQVHIALYLLRRKTKTWNRYPHTGMTSGLKSLIGRFPAQMQTLVRGRSV